MNLFDFSYEELSQAELGDVIKNDNEKIDLDKVTDLFMRVDWIDFRETKFYCIKKTSDIDMFDVFLIKEDKKAQYSLHRAHLSAIFDSTGNTRIFHVPRKTLTLKTINVSKDRKDYCHKCNTDKLYWKAMAAFCESCNGYILG